MLDIGGSNYIIDLEKLSELLSDDESLKSQEITETEINEVRNEKGELVATEKTTKTYNKGKEIDASRYDIFRMFFEVLLTYNEEFDDTLGFDRAMQNATLPFKITFNTLLNYGVLKEVEINE
jgi:hypothetical protein